MSSRVTIIGMGAGDSSAISRERLKDIHECNILIGAKRFLESFAELPAEKVQITSDLDSLVDTVRNNSDKKIVVLASGDPNLYGISDFILKKISPDDLRIHPNISSMQFAFAAAKISMNNAIITSAHGRDIGRVIDTINSNDKVGIFTTNEETPHQIARALREKRSGDFDMYICEDLCYETERVIKTDVHSISDRTFSPLNVMIVLRKESGKTSFATLLGISDDDFYHREGMITKSEVRVLDISKLRLHADSIVWDIGAGCGSLSIESASIVHKGAVFSIERDAEQYEFLQQNSSKFGMKNITTINGSAPDVLKNLPSPDRVFIGGSGGRLKDILILCKEKIKTGGIIVINAVTLNTLMEGTAALKENNFSFEVFTINISKTKELNGNHLFKSTSPIYIIVGEC